MADIDLKTATPDTSLPTDGFLFGADSQAAASPSVFTVQSVATTLLGSTTLTGAAGLTADAPVLNMSQTWNNNAVTFTGLKFNATNTASASGSLLMDLQTNTGGAPTSRFSVGKNGDIRTGAASQGSITTLAASFGNGTWYVSSSRGPTLSSVGDLNWVASGTPSGGTIDTTLTRRAAANLRLGAADAAGSAIAVSSVATNQLTLASSHGLTSGAAVIITGTTAPSGTSLNTLYYARSISAAVIELYLTFDAATATSGTTGIVAVTTAGTSASIRLSTPFQRLSPQDFTGTDIPGQPLLINGSRGTGTGPGGSIIFQVAPAGSTGATQNALATALQVNGNGGITGQDGATANTLALRNGTNAQTFNIYNTFTDASNYERGRMQWSGSEWRIGTEALGTGTLRSMGLYSGGTRYQIIGGGFNQFDQNIYMNVANIVTDTSTGFKIGTATTQKIGFWNATPIVQPTTAVAAATVAATGVGDVVAASTTFDGYTIPQIVKAMRNAGLLA